MLYFYSDKMIESERKIITASAAENLDTINERVIHRFIPMLVAENINRIIEYESGKLMPRVDLWNCVGMRMDKAFMSQQNRYKSRKAFSYSLLVDKYKILEELGIPSKGRDVIRDDDDSTKTWLEQKIEQLLSTGAIYIDSVGVNICDTCGYMQSVDNIRVNSCTICESDSFHSEKRNVLIVDIPKDRESLIRDRIIHPRNTEHVRGLFYQLPPRMMISRIREYGLPLDSIGLEGYVLDPKIGVALMPQLVAEKYELSELTLAQGAIVATNAIPYTSILTSGFHHNYLLLPKIPNTSLEEAKNIGLGFIARYLPLALMTYSGDITPDQLEIIRKEYARINWKIDIIISSLQSEKEQSLRLGQEDHQRLAEIFKDFTNYRIRAGQIKLGKFFKTQGKRYAEEMRHRGYYLNPIDIDTLENIIKLFYK
jgi:hypothetical protein